MITTHIAQNTESLHLLFHIFFRGREFKHQAKYLQQKEKLEKHFFRVFLNSRLQTKTLRVNENAMKSFANYSSESTLNSKSHYSCIKLTQKIQAAVQASFSKDRNMSIPRRS